MTSSLLTRLAGIRETYAQGRTLRRELSAYTTASDLNDLEAAVARWDEDDPETQRVRRILAAQRAARAA